MKYLFYLLIFCNSNLQLQAQRPNSFQYIVKDQDKSLWGICQRFGTSVSKVQALTNKNDALIHLGDTLHIPLEQDFMLHMVSKKDKSLWNISQMYKVPVYKIKQFNQKEENQIFLNETLIIPKAYLPIWNKKEKHLSYSLWKNLQYPLFDIDKQKEQFLYQNKKTFYISESLKQRKLKSQKISPEEYIELYQDRTEGPHEGGPSHYKHYTELYYYSFHATFLMDQALKNTISSSKMPKYAYSLTPITLLEYDTSNSKISIRYLLYHNEQIGDLENENWAWGTLQKGTFACCYHSPILASYQQTDSTITEVKSELLSPLLIKQTTTYTELKNNKTYKTSKEIFILEVSPYDSPTLKDEAAYKNGQLSYDFKDKTLRKKYKY